MKYTLGEICEIVSGGTPSRAKPEYWNNGTIPWIKIGNIKGKYIHEADEFITDAGLKSSSAKMLPKGTILYTIFATLGEVGILDIEACTNQAIAGVTIKDTSNVLSEYVYYYLMSKKKYINSLGRGVAQNNINMSILRSFEVTLPSIDEQNKIVSVLDVASDIIVSRKQQLQKLDELIKARFVEMFGDPVSNPKGWSVKPLLEMGSCKNGMNFHYDDVGVEIHCLGVGDFQNNDLISDTSTLPVISLNNMPTEEYLLKDGDIVFVRSNGNKALVGRSVAVYPRNVPTTFSGFCIRYRKNDEALTTPYLLNVLKSDSMRAKMTGRGVNIQNLNQQILGSLKIPVPPLSLQNRFAEFVSQVDKSKAAVQKALDKAQFLFDSLMQKYFG
ncbi:MAG: restriction endonuclease subunit S [Clostridia bacterium]|nr:restriction endonuclease subunit S [Clostridia bacterium]